MAVFASPLGVMRPTVPSRDTPLAVDSQEIEGVAEAMLRGAGMDPLEDVRMARLARALGVEVVRSAAAPFPGSAALVRVGAVWRVYLRTRLPPARARFALAHELAEWWLRSTGYAGERVEAVANRLGAALVAPRPRVARLVRVIPSLTELAAELESSESLAALRVGEATGEPIALVSPARVRVRGEPWAWPSEAELRRARRGPAPPGLVKVELEERGRVVLRAEAG